MGRMVFAEVFDAVAEPVGRMFTRGAMLRDWRVLAIDGFDADLPNSDQNAAEFRVELPPRPRRNCQRSSSNMHIRSPNRRSARKVPPHIAGRLIQRARRPANIRVLTIQGRIEL